MITIEKSNQIQKNLDTFYKAILPSEKSQYKKSMRIMATSEDSFYRDVSKPFLDYMRLKIVRDIRRAVIKAKTTPTLFTEFVDWEDISTKGKQLSKPAYVKILEKSGNQAAVVARVEAGFDVMNVNSIKWAEKYTAEMVTEVTRETKKALREVISDGMKQKWNKLKIARRINKMPIGLSLPQTKALNNFRDKLISDGASAKLIDKRVQSYYNRLLRQRSRSIARTETSRAVNEGYLQGLEQQNVYRRVKISMAADACPLCTEHEGRIFTLEEAHAFLPIHPNCRCAWVVVWSKRPSFMMPPPWKPTMTQAEADEWAKGSVYADDTFYHGTNTEAVTKIKQDGFKLTNLGKKTGNGGFGGAGHYVSPDKGYAQCYGGAKGETLQIKVNVKNILKGGSIEQKELQEFAFQASGAANSLGNISLVEARKRALFQSTKEALNHITEKDWIAIKNIMKNEKFGIEMAQRYLYQSRGYDAIDWGVEKVIFTDKALTIIK